MIESNKQAMAENAHLLDELHSKTIEVERLRDKLSDAEKCLDEIADKTNINADCKLENEYLSADIQRLLNLLLSTQEVNIYKLFID